MKETRCVNSSSLARLIVGLCLVIALGACKTAAPPATNFMPVDFDPELGEHAWPGEQEATQAITNAITEQIESDYVPGTSPARRDAHPRAHGCVRAIFTVADALKPKLVHGVFQPGAQYAAWIRFSNGSADATRPDGKSDARGMAIKLMGVTGPKLAADEQSTQDFILINHPVFFVDDPKRYADFFQRQNSGNPFARFSAPLALGLRSILLAREVGASQIANPLFERYFTMVPYRLGEDPSTLAVKFSARACIPRQNDPDALSMRNPTYLRTAMQAVLEQEEACFEFLAQPRTSTSMSVERSMIEWKESEAPFYKVATITIPKQTFDLPAQHAFCENLSFSPWHALAAHRPLGVVNRVRKVVYETISGVRHELNGQQLREPTGNETF